MVSGNGFGGARGYPLNVSLDPPMGEVPAGECFGEMTLMAPPPHERKKKYSLTCTAEQCEIVNIDGADFLRLLEKSRCMVRSMERLRAERERQNRQAEEKPS